MGTDACHFYLIYLLGCTGRAVFPPRHPQAPAGQEDVRHLQASRLSGIRTSAHLPGIRRRVLCPSQPATLDTEYRRDLGKGLPIDMPKYYYRDDCPDKGPIVRWRSTANLLFSNWLNYYVYQTTPYDINTIE